MSAEAMTDETYVPLSRGLEAHLPKLSGLALKLYIKSLIRAKFTGLNKGKFSASFSDLALELGVHYQSVYKAAKELKPYYITWKPARNQYGGTVFEVQRFKTVEDFALSHTTKSSTKSEVKASRKQGKSTPSNPHEQQGLLVPNNGNKGKNEKKETLPSEAAPAWDHAKAKFLERYGQEPDWSAQKHWQGVLRFVKKHSLEEFKKRWDCFIWTSDPYYSKQGGSLAWFCANADKFIEDGRVPVPGAKPNGGGKFAAYNRTGASLRER